MPKRKNMVTLTITREIREDRTYIPHSMRLAYDFSDDEKRHALMLMIAATVAASENWGIGKDYLGKSFKAFAEDLLSAAPASPAGIGGDRA